MLATLLAMTASAAAMPKCLPHSQAGVIVAIEGATPANGKPPYLARQNVREDPSQGELLCPGDVIVNPAGSGATIRYRLSGQKTTILAPGTANLTVPETGFHTQVAMLSQRVQDLFDYMAFRASGVRGGSDDHKGLYPLPPEIFAVSAWGPLVVAWDGGSAGTATIREGGQVREITGRGVIKIDLKSYCAATCSLRLNIPAVGTVSETTITVLAVQDAMTRLNMKQFEPGAPSIVIAGWFGAGRQDPAWRWQHASLLWNAACSYPAFAPLAQEFYGLQSEPDACSDAAHE